MKKELVSRQKNNQTLELIRSTVDKLVEEVGFEKMTIRDICSEVGIGVGTFYYYFATKNDLLVDRYIRTSDYFEALYENQLSKLNEIEALKIFTQKHIEYASTRVYSIHKSYFQSLMNEYSKWEEIYPNKIVIIVNKLVFSGQQKKIITSKYSSEDIATLILSLLKGIQATYFTNNAQILSNKNILSLIHDFIDSLSV